MNNPNFIYTHVDSPEVGPESDAETVVETGRLAGSTHAARLGISLSGPRDVALGVTPADATDDGVDPTRIDKEVSAMFARVLGGIALKNTDPLA